MSYTPTEWKKGDVVTSAKLNKLERGVAGAGALVVNFDVATDALDRTWQEIADASFAVIKMSDEFAYIAGVLEEMGSYVITSFHITPTGTVDVTYFVAETADGYPAYFDPNS